ncbi:MAG TPA: aminoglycoside phosphotransferase family protein, partial [Steroidobacteraceae bacterium]|nr:aminoglycoside phosphotransferase family protein [Steroidobacteraceae bacterium]
EQTQEGVVEYVCMTRMPGVAARHAKLEGPSRAGMLRRLGRTLRWIHEAPQEPLTGSGLFPSDQTQGGLRLRLSSTFGRLADAFQPTPEEWPLDQSPQDVAAAALRALPKADAMLALHSNPGPEHVFVDPATGAFSGLIDFGDAYISHPALDLRQWPAAEDRAAVLEGYTADGGVSDAFLAIWRIALIQAQMMAIVYHRQDRSRVAENLLGLLAAL